MEPVPTAVTTSGVLGRPAGPVVRLVDSALAVVRLPRQMVEEAARLTVRAMTLVGRVEMLLDEIAAIAARADLLVSKADAVAEDAGEAVALAQTQLQRLQALMPALLQLEPVLRQGGDVLEPRHADSVATLLDLTPEVIDLISPALRNLGDLTPELHALAERFEAMGQFVEGLPGAKMFKRRGAAEEVPPG